MKTETHVIVVTVTTSDDDESAAAEAVLYENVEPYTESLSCDLAFRLNEDWDDDDQGRVFSASSRPEYDDPSCQTYLAVLSQLAIALLQEEEDFLAVVAQLVAEETDESGAAPYAALDAALAEWVAEISASIGGVPVEVDPDGVGAVIYYPF